MMHGFAMDFSIMMHFIRRWVEEESGVAFMEAALMTPSLMVLLMGAFDLGNGIMLNQKTITAAQIAGDLVARQKEMNDTELSQAIEGARLAYDPYSSASFGIDVVSIRFDANQDPEILWRETQNMPANDEAVDSVTGMGEEGEGIIIVSVRYVYEPFFSNFFVNSFDMQEVAFSRGRRAPTVDWES